MLNLKERMNLAKSLDEGNRLTSLSDTVGKTVLFMLEGEESVVIIFEDKTFITLEPTCGESYCRCIIDIDAGYTPVLTII